MSAQVFELPPSTFSQRSFFVPGQAHESETLEKWQELSSHPHSKRKVQRLIFTNNGDRYVAEVDYALSDEESRWLVAAIFEPQDQFPDSPWHIALLRIRNGEVVTRPSWPVPRKEVLEAKDFAMPSKSDDIEHEDPARETADTAESVGGDKN